MRTLLFFAFRNLFRQKRRAVLLGTAMALGTCFLVLASSFVAGISQTLFDRVMTYVAGHVSVVVGDRGYLYRTALRGEVGLEERIRALPHVKRVQETMGIMCRMIGPRKGDNAILIGIDMDQRFTAQELEETRDNFPMLEGSFMDLLRTDVENPAILAKSKAEFVGVRRGDILPVRYQDSRGRHQVANLTVVGIFQPANAFMEAPLFVSMRRAKALMDMDSTDLPYLYLTLEDPKTNAIPTADTIQKMLASRPAALTVSVVREGREAAAVAAGVRSDSVSAARLKTLVALADAWKGQVAILPESLATILDARVGDTVELRSGLARSGDSMVDRVRVAGLWKPPAGAAELVLWEEDAFQAVRSFGAGRAGEAGRREVEAAAAIFDTLLSPEWALLPRARTTDAVRDQMRLIGARTWKAPVVAVRTMYEMGEQILKLASALDVIALVAVLVLFAVVLTGVVNTLRMTVRERTREIGTLRALGMQAREVRILFLLETALLALFSAFAGLLLASGLMAWFSSLVFPIEGNPLSMLLVRGHLVFVPGILTTLGQVLLVVGMAVVSAWSPAAQAARLVPANALRHHE